MAVNKRRSRGFAIYIAVLVVLLILAVALFIYGCATNGVTRPQLPGQSLLSHGTMLHHG